MLVHILCVISTGDQIDQGRPAADGGSSFVRPRLQLVLFFDSRLLCVAARISLWSGSCPYGLRVFKF